MNKAQRRLVVWGVAVFALVLHLTFYRWGWGLDNAVWTVQLAGPQREYAHRDQVFAGLYKSDLGERHPASSTVFGLLAPLALVGVAGFVWLGGRKGDDGESKGQ